MIWLIVWLVLVGLTLALMRVSKQADQRASEFDQEWRRS